MSVSKGIYRIAQAIKWTGRVLGGIGVMAICYSVLTSPLTQMDAKENLALFGIAGVLVAITEGIGWILEGFGSE
jgi:hypothetical protein